MPKKNSSQGYDTSFKRSAVEYMKTSGGSVDDASAELGIDAQALRQWSQTASAGVDKEAGIGTIDHLRSENQALRAEVGRLEGQWNVLKTTLSGMASTLYNRKAA